MENRLNYEIVSEINKSKNITMDNIVFNTSIVVPFLESLREIVILVNIKLVYYSRNGLYIRWLVLKKW